MKLAVARLPLVGGDDAVERRLLLALTGHADRDGHGDPRLGIERRQSTQASSELSTCYMTRPCSGGWPALALAWPPRACCSKSEVKGAGRRPDARRRPSPRSRCSRSPRCAARSARAAARPTRSATSRARRSSSQDARAAGPVARGRRRVPAVLAVARSRRTSPPQEELKADLLAQHLQGRAAGRRRSGSARPTSRRARQAVRLPRAGRRTSTDPHVAARAAEARSTVGGAKVGVFGVIARTRSTGSRSTDPVAAGKAAVAELREQGRAGRRRARAGAVASKDAVAARARRSAASTSRSPGLGLNAPEPDRRRDRADEGRRRLARHPGEPRPGRQPRSTSRCAAAPGRSSTRSARRAATAKIARARQAARRARRRPREVRGRQRPPIRRSSREAGRARRSSPRSARRSQTQPLVVAGARQLLHARSDPDQQDARVQRRRCRTEVTDVRPAAGEANVKAAAGKPPVPGRRRARRRYVGMEACADCHEDAVDVLEEDRARAGVADARRSRPAVRLRLHRLPRHRLGQAGRLEPRAQRQAARRPVRDLPRPGVDPRREGRRGEAARDRRATPPTDLCATQCHTHEHSDTFQHEAYLRDIVGPGHGEELRAKLGDGPTGHELRKAALDKAGHELGAGLHAVRAMRASRSRWCVACASSTSQRPAARRRTARRPDQPDVQRGYATWYGESQMTASGERFDKHALTAAHRTLPLGTRVRVTNQQNGRSR